MDDWRSYDRIADAYEALWTPRFVTVARRLLELAPPTEGLRVLDLGAGTGAVARALGDALPRLGWMIGCDLSFGMLKQARLPPPFRPVVGDILRLPLRAAALDLVTANCVLSHVPDHQAALREILRVLARPGALLASNWKISPLEAFFSRPENVRASLTSAGFETVRVEDTELASRHTVEQYVAERSLNAPARLARQLLGEAGWQAFIDRARAEFRRRFGGRVGFSRRVLLAVGTVR
jgi:ubiquinone/menaquinone biosynthesis C-methylase UbiE